MAAQRPQPTTHSQHGGTHNVCAAAPPANTPGNSKTHRRTRLCTPAASAAVAATAIATAGRRHQHQPGPDTSTASPQTTSTNVPENHPLPCPPSLQLVPSPQFLSPTPAPIRSWVEMCCPPPPFALTPPPRQLAGAGFRTPSAHCCPCRLTAPLRWRDCPACTKPFTAERSSPLLNLPSASTS